MINLFRTHPPKVIFGEMWKHISGYYLTWKKTIGITKVIQLITIILFSIILISLPIACAMNYSVVSFLSSNGEWTKLSVVGIFRGDYGGFIGDSNVTQPILLKFAVYVFFIRIIGWSLIIFFSLYSIRFFLSSSLYLRKLNLMALDVGLNPLPICTYRKMKGMELEDKERTINFTKTFNEFMNLQNFPPMDPNKTLVRSNNLSFNYEKHWFPRKMRKRISQKNQPNVSKALEDINLNINPSLFTSILGCNGSSKSTLLKAIINLFEDYSGDIQWLDKDLKKISHKSFYRNVAYIAQETIIQNKITVYDYVACGLFPSFSLFRFSYPKDHPVILENLEKMGILHYRDKYINSLSGGEKQKTILARALTQKTPVIILDEPTTYLDIKNQYLILNLLKKLQKEENKTIITILHDIRQAEQFSDEVIILDSGRIYASGKTKEVITKENIEKVFGISYFREN